MSLSLVTTADARTLSERLRQRDAAAWEALVADQYARLYSLHLRLTGDREAAADLTQETFAAAYRGAHTFAGRARPDVWLYGIALNRNRDWHRKAGHQDPAEPLGEELADPEPTPEQVAELRERSDVVLDAVRRLPTIYRHVVALRYFADVPTKEIAAAEGIAEVAVRWRLHKALRKLWVMLEAKLGKEPEDEPGAAGQLRIAP